MYVPNNRASNYLRQKLIEQQGERDDSTVIIGKSTSLSQKWTDPVDRKSVST